MAAGGVLLVLSALCCSNRLACESVIVSALSHAVQLPSDSYVEDTQSNAVLSFPHLT